MPWKFFNASGSQLTATDNVTVAALADGTDGELITWDTAGAPATVAVGTSGHVLTSGGTGVAPTFQAAAGTTINTNADNRVITGSGTADTLNGEANLTFDGTNLTVGTGNVIVGTAGKGIDFSNQASPAAGMASELLDHYEEGTFTPGISDSSLDPEGNDKSQAYLSNGQVGRYVRIGRTVFIHGWVDLTSHSMTGGDTANLVGLPFTSLTLTNYRAALAIGEGGGMAISANATPGGRISSNTAYSAMFVWDSTAGITSLTITKLGSSGNFSFTGQYEV